MSRRAIYIGISFLGLACLTLGVTITQNPVTIGASAVAIIASLLGLLSH